MSRTFAHLLKSWGPETRCPRCLKPFSSILSHSTALSTPYKATPIIISFITNASAVADFVLYLRGVYGQHIYFTVLLDPRLLVFAHQNTDQDYCSPCFCFPYGRKEFICNKFLRLSVWLRRSHMCSKQPRTFWRSLALPQMVLIPLLFPATVTS